MVTSLQIKDRGLIKRVTAEAVEREHSQPTTTAAQLILERLTQIEVERNQRPQTPPPQPGSVTKAQ